MRRLFIPLLIWIGVGAGTSVVVGVVCAFSSDTLDGRHNYEPSHWPFAPPDGGVRWPDRPDVAIFRSSFWWDETRHMAIERSSGSLLTMKECRAGVPFRSLESWGSWTNLTRPRMESAIDVPLPSGRKVLVPLFPAWRGLALNTIVYAAIVWGAGQGVRAVRRSWRGSRGRCRGCGYRLEGLGGGAVCPECGAELARASPQTGDRPERDVPA